VTRRRLGSSDCPDIAISTHQYTVRQSIEIVDELGSMVRPVRVYTRDVSKHSGETASWWMVDGGGWWMVDGGKFFVFGSPGSDDSVNIPLIYILPGDI